MTVIYWRRHIAHTEARHLRQLPVHLWHHAYEHSAVLRLYLDATGRIPTHRAPDFAPIVARDATWEANADKRARHAAWKREQRAAS